nr:phospholipase D-like domain-containing protein [Clostridium pasteurianum]
MNSSDVKLDIAIYSLNKQSIVDSIINAKNRGVDVKIITDGTESKNKSESKELKELQSKGIPIKINEHSGLMNLKLTIEDNTQVATGSYNYTEDSSKENDEVLVIINDVNTAQNFENEFNTMWNDNKNYTNY